MSDVPGHWVEQLKDVASRLDQVVVSFDRIGSREAVGEAGAEELRNFLDRWDIARSLAEARRHVYGLLEETVDRGTLGEDEDFLDRLGIVERPAWPEERTD